MMNSTVKNREPENREVMIVIAGFSTGREKLSSLMKKISDDGKIPIENDHAQILIGSNEVQWVVDDWTEEIAINRHRKNGRDVMSLALSVPFVIELEKLKHAAMQFTKENFGNNYQYIFALHENERPKVHLLIKMHGHDNTRINPRKKDLYMWRNSFAKQLEKLNIKASSSSKKKIKPKKKKVTAKVK